MFIIFILSFQECKWLNRSRVQYESPTPLWSYWYWKDITTPKHCQGEETSNQIWFRAESCICKIGLCTSPPIFPNHYPGHYVSRKWFHIVPTVSYQEEEREEESDSFKMNFEKAVPEFGNTRWLRTYREYGMSIKFFDYWPTVAWFGDQRYIISRLQIGQNPENMAHISFKVHNSVTGVGQLEQKSNMVTW
jgi:hypothetical protein